MTKTSLLCLLFVFCLIGITVAYIADNQGTGTITNDEIPETITMSFQDGVNGYSGTRDTRLLSRSPNTNYGNLDEISVDGRPDESSLLHWDLTDIPVGSNVQSVDFTFTVTNKTRHEYEIYSLRQAWIESEATWNEYALGQSWEISGADGAADRNTTALGSIIASTTGTYTISLNASGVTAVQSWVNDPSSNYGIIIMDYISASDGMNISSRETGTMSNRPKLTVTYSTSTGPTIPDIVIDDIIVVEGNTGTVNAVFTVSLSAASAQTVTVDYATADGTATAPGDYNSVPVSTLTFSPGTTTQTITVVVNGDIVYEEGETFAVDLNNAVNASIADNQGVGTITDDDVPSIFIDDVMVTEGNTGTVNAVFTISLSAASAQTITVNYTTSDGTATAPEDYNSIPLSTLTFSPGVTTQTITVVVNGDAYDEVDETFTIDLSNVVNANFADNQGTGTITDDEGVPSISIDDVAVTEGNAGTVNAVFTVSLSRTSAQIVTVDFTTSVGTATASGDYTAIPLSTLSFTPGVIEQNITVEVNGDVVDEADEIFIVDLNNAVNANIMDTRGICRIRDDDSGPSMNLIYEETLEGPEPFSTANGIEVGDWNYALQIVSSPAIQGNHSARFEIREDQPLVQDGKRAEVSIVKGSEGDITKNTWYSFAVYFPSAGYEYDDQREVINQWYQSDSPSTSLRTEEDKIILETGNAIDSREEIEIGAITKDVWHTFIFHFIHSYGSDGLIEVWHNENKIITRTGGNMYDDVLPKWKIGLYKSSFKYGTSMVDKRIIFFDSIRVSTISDDYAPPTISINDVSVTEGNTGTVNAVFTVSLSAASAQTVTVDYNTSDGTATAPGDYNTVSLTTLSFAPGITSQTITVGVNGDVFVESDESFTVDLSNAVNGLLGDGQGLGIISNDDNPGQIINVPSDFQTVQEAFDAAVDGDTIIIAPGTYIGSFILGGKSVLLASWFLTKGDSSYIAQTILDGNNGLSVITVENTVGPSTTIMGLTIQNAEDGISVHAKFNLLNCYINNCRDGIDYEDGSGGICKFNIFENNRDDGIDLDHIVDLIIEDNIIRNNHNDGIEIRIQPYEGPLLTYNIRRNIIHDNGIGGSEGGDGIQLIDYDTFSDRIFIIEDNLIYNNSHVGLGCMGGENSIENFEGASISERIYLFNNTFSGNFYGVTGGDSLVALNNIFVNHSGIAIKDSDAGSIVTNNLLWNNGTDFENCNVDLPTILFADPQLDSHFQLQPSSPAINAGIISYIWNDETILNRHPSSYNSTAPDLGAFEFGDIPVASLAINDVEVTEGNTGTVNAVFTVSLSAASAQTVTVDYETSDGTATAPGDYNSIPLSTLTFSPGVTTQTITVVVNGDVVDEPDETFSVNLSNPVNATIADNQGTGTITDDDIQVPITISFQDGVNGYNGTRDTQLLNDYPNTNYGSGDRLSADGSPDESVLFYWDLTTIPVGSSIQTVDFTFNVRSKTVNEYEIYNLKRAWIESQATWNVYATGQSWQISGANGGADRGTTVLGSITAPTTGIYTISLNAAGVATVQSWVNDPSSNYGFIVMDYTNATDGLDFSSRETGTTSERPRLTVTYSSYPSARIYVSGENLEEVERTAQPALEKISIISNYPNPFSLSTTIEYELPIDLRVKMTIYDMSGHIVCNLADEVMIAGRNSIIWNGRDEMGNTVKSGIYLIQVMTKETRIIKKMILQK